MTDRFFKPLSVTIGEQLEWARHPLPRIPLGYPMFDGRTSGGAAQGELIQFLARSGVGKTTMALNLINNVCHGQGVPTVFFSLEMHGRYIVQRLAAIAFDEPTARIEKELFDTGRSPHLENLSQLFPRLSIVDEPGLSFRQMGKALQEAEDEWGEKVRFVAVDYAELIGGVRSMTTAEKVDGVMKDAKDFARKHDVLLLLLHQVGRGSGGEGHMPLAATSGRFGGEQAADYILAAYRTHLEPGISHQEMLARQHSFHLQFLKTRGGHEIHPQGVQHIYKPGSMRIEPPAPPRQLEIAA